MPLIFPPPSQFLNSYIFDDVTVKVPQSFEKEPCLIKRVMYVAGAKIVIFIAVGARLVYALYWRQVISYIMYFGPGRGRRNETKIKDWGVGGGLLGDRGATGVEWWRVGSVQMDIYV